jgi:hypothetical protein
MADGMLSVRKHAKPKVVQVRLIYNDNTESAWLTGKHAKASKRTLSCVSVDASMLLGTAVGLFCIVTEGKAELCMSSKTIEVCCCHILQQTGN